MSVTFTIEGSRANYDDVRSFVNVSNLNARALLEWLGYDAGPWLVGALEAGDLAARCRRRLWDERRNFDPATADVHLPRAVLLGRSAGYLRRRCQKLLEASRRPQGSVQSKFA